MIIPGSDLQSKQNTYLTAEQVAELLGCSKQWARELADVYGAISVKSSFGGGSSGTSYRFPLHNLPPEAQRKYIEMQTKTIKTAYETAPQWIRDQAEQRLWLLEEWEDYCIKNLKLKKAEKFKAFAAGFSRRCPEIKISLASLYRWEKAYREKGMDGLLGKIPTQPQRKIHPEAWQRFCELYLRPQRLSISYCYDLVEMEGADKGWWLPTKETVARLVRTDIPEGIRRLQRLGVKNAYDNATPFTRRDPDSISSGQIYVGDHHMLDLMVIHNGKAKRPWLTAWLDMRSHKFVGWMVTLSPCTNTIIGSLAKAAMDPAIGLPREIYIDNGRDYCSYRFAGRGYRGKPMSEDDQARLIAEGKQVASLTAHLDIKVHYAIVENARAKVIERAFKDVVERFSKNYSTYCGRSTIERPEDHNDTIRKMLKNHKKGRAVLTLEDIKTDLDTYIRQIWNKTPSAAGRGRKAECPDETFTRTRLPVRRATPDTCKLLFMKSTNPRKIGRNGITFRGEEYYNPDFLLIKGQSVYIRYDEDDLSKIYVYSTKDEYLGTAERVEALPAIGADPELLAQEMARKTGAMKRLKNHPLTKAAKAADLPSISEIAAMFAKNKPAPDPEPTDVIELVQTSREVNRSAKRLKAAGDTLNINPFEAMLQGTIIPRKERWKK